MNKKILTLDDYQTAARRTAIYPHKGKNLIYAVIGLNGEAGELANKVKKLMRSYGLDTDIGIPQLKLVVTNPKGLKIIRELKGELGGILWYVAACANELGYDLNEIGIHNLNELSGRVKRGNVEGDGDDRGKTKRSN